VSISHSSLLSSLLSSPQHQEYKRLRLLNKPDKFRVILNKTYTISPTYPGIFIIPSGMSDEELKKICNFRSKARVPATVFLHPVTGATLSRCSQPLVGYVCVCVCICVCMYVCVCGGWNNFVYFTLHCPASSHSCLSLSPSLWYCMLFTHFCAYMICIYVCVCVRVCVITV